MNIKSLLLGSAAAMVAATGARAADAIVIAEPEPMEYVRICDVYGAGYFYIPGTETCLKIGGWVRYEIFTSDDLDGWSKTSRARLEFNTRNESEWGTVAGYIRLDSRLVNGIGTRSGTRDNRLDNQYSLGIGGLEMGFRDSQWNRFSGYGGLTDAGGSYGYQERHYISYTFTGGAGFSGIISLDHDNDTSDYAPDVMAGVGFDIGSARTTLSAAYDESVEEFAIKGTLNAPIGPATLRIAGFYASDTNAYTPFLGDAVGAGDWSVIVGLGAPLTAATAVAVDFQYIPMDIGDDYWTVIGNVNHTIAPGLSALLEVAYDSEEDWSGMLRFQRSF
jgi:hypothetical protein